MLFMLFINDLLLYLGLFKEDFIKVSHKPLSKVTISGIASSLKVVGIRTTLYKYKNDNNN